MNTKSNKDKAPIAPRVADLSQARREFLKMLLESEGIDASGLPIAPHRDLNTAPLSFAQQRLWFLHKLEPGNPAYNILTALRLHGRLDVPALEQSLNEIIRRHEALRTTFGIIEKQLQQIISPYLSLRLTIVDIDGLTEDERELEIHSLARIEAQAPFDLAHGPLLRATLLRLGHQEHVLLLTMHHIVCDGWSMGVLVREMAALYEAYARGESSPLAELPIQYADFARWQHEWVQDGALANQISYWKEKLGGELPVLNLATDRPRPATQTYSGAVEAIAFSRSSFEKLKTLSQEEGATTFMGLLAVFKILLFRYTGEEDIIVGSPIAGRNRSETEELIGFFLNTLVLRTDLSGNPSFRQLLRRVRETTLGAYQHQDLPFERLLDELKPERDMSRSPLFQVMLVFQNAPTPDLQAPGLSFSYIQAHNGASQFDLNLLMTETPQQGLLGFLEYNTDLFEAATVRHLLQRFQMLLDAVVNHPERSISMLPMLTETERRQQLVQWNHTQTDYGPDQPLHQLFESQVKRTPEVIAVSYDEVDLTYRELNSRANQLARYLRSLGAGPEALVGICMERSIEMVIALLAVLKAGCAYVPLEPTYPPRRLALMADDAGLLIILAQQHLVETLTAAGRKLICLDSQWPSIAVQSDENPVNSVEVDSLAYVIYTSGSTGAPKGAMNTHRGICNRLLWMQDAYRLTADDRVLQKTPFSFDVSVWEFFWPLLFGARLVLARPGGHQDTSYLVRLIGEQKITSLHFVPSHLQVFLEERRLETCLSLRRVICSGEVLTPSLQQRFFSRLDAELHNLYGPTEASIDVTARPCEQPVGLRILIGRPIANIEIYILDPHLQLLPAGVAGELHLGGVGVGRGYLGRPELTAARFIPHPFSTGSGERLYKTGDLARYLPDGEIEFLGRNDQQVKIRGFRVELGEIEMALSRHPSIREAVVLAREDAPGERRLVAYLTVRKSPLPSVTELRSLVEDALPDYMVPAAFMFLEALPLTPSGKVARQSLPAPGPERPTIDQVYVAPQTPQEMLLASIWAQVLQLDRVGIHDNYFALGGDSIRSIQILAQAEVQGLSFSLPQLFRHQTIYKLLQDLKDIPIDGEQAAVAEPFSLISQEDRSRLEGGLEDAYPLARLQLGMLFHSKLKADSAIYHDIISLHLEARFDQEKFAVALRELTARHPLLRTSFNLSDFSEPLQLVHQQVRVLPLAVADLRALSAAGQEEVLVAHIEAEKGRNFDWASAPLLRLQVYLRTDESFQLILSFHHAILDGWSVAVVLTELFQLYLPLVKEKAPPIGPSPALAYRDFVNAERAAIRSEEQSDYWRQKLEESTMTTLARWPLLQTIPPVSRILVHQVPLTAEVSKGLKHLARSLKVPLKSPLLAAHLRVLSIMSGQNEVLTGLVSHGRPEEIDGERILGLFLNTVPFRQRLNGGTWADLIRETFELEYELLPFRRYPLAEIQRIQGGRPLFETAFNLNHFHVYQSMTLLDGVQFRGGKSFEATDITLTAKFNLDVYTHEVQLNLDYDAAELCEEQIKVIGEYYARTLTAMIANPLARYEYLPLLSETERQPLQVQWNAPAEEFCEECVHHLFEAQVERTPEAIAVRCGNEQLTYKELDLQANQLAHHLQSLGVGAEMRIGICMERSMDMLVGLLGILKAGGAYVPLDPQYPLERLTFMLEDAQIAVLLTQERLLDSLPSHASLIVCVDAEWDVIATQSGKKISSAVSPQNLANVMYTSGSTGLPKGVMTPHGALAHYLNWSTKAYAMHEGSGALLHSSLAFDLTVTSLFSPLIAGLTVHVLTENNGFDALGVTLRSESGFSLIKVTPAHLKMLSQQLSAEQAAGSANVLVIGGEALMAEDLAFWRASAPHPRLVNEYGPTEAAVGCCVYEVDELTQTAGAVPIGRPIPNTQLYVLDQHLMPTPIAVPGELYIGGAGLARGYLNHPALSAERFVPAPFSERAGARLYRTGDMARYLEGGNLEFLGRQDEQVKLRGYRIELGEIQAVLKQHPGVSEAVVLLRQDEPGDKRLVAYVVGNLQSPISSNDLRAFLGEKVPDYMLPASIVLLEEMPLTPHGKVDRQALPAPSAAKRAPDAIYVAPRTSMEEEVAKMWGEVLKVEKIGVHDNFFELGGHSLLAIQLLSRLQNAFQVELWLDSFFEKPTVAETTTAIVQMQVEEADREILTQALAEVESLEEDEAQRTLAAADLLAGEQRDE